MDGIFDVKTLTEGQFNVVYNVLSFGFASMLATTVFLYISSSRDRKSTRLNSSHRT